MEPKVELSTLAFGALKTQIELIQQNAETTILACKSLLNTLERAEKASGLTFETGDNYSQKKCKSEQS